MFMWIVVVISSIWVFIDAKKIGVRKGLVTGLGNMGPGYWLFCCLFIWIVAFPLYLIKRDSFKKALQGNGSVADQKTTGHLNGSLADLEKLAALKDKGIISETEFQAKKQEILG